LSLSGVVLSTVYQLVDLDYNTYIISDNLVEFPVDQTADLSKMMLGTSARDEPASNLSR
jgi:nicotinamidase-related amidase